MGRKPRIEFNGALYHVIQRGNNKEYIFKNDREKQYFLSKLKEFKDIMNSDVYGYVIMDNHYHIVIRSIDVNISMIMQRVNNDFSKYYIYISEHIQNTSVPVTWVIELLGNNGKWLVFSEIVDWEVDYVVTGNAAFELFGDNFDNVFQKRQRCPGT